ncbi:hypothetical protein FHS18_002125 [Paenibacillus phyllosphaerae]|uniref:DUF1835 domain-containing protein n=1 Tax=Paenibacillus phyllosphaerae TaxID=274593 RepID=A0A7W5AWE7_9BACL|nr:DUF1835 domain-containing protein [Paenibacillus phyllosphaerae]MBB3110058.1 hypothetical protein [Paenibacillus phyllosphaerae]
MKPSLNEQLNGLYQHLQHPRDRQLPMLFYSLLKKIERLDKEGSDEEKQLAAGLVRLLHEHTETVNDHRLQREAQQTHVHIVFSLSDAGSMKVTIGDIGKREQSQVLAFNDVFSVGPITELDTEAGQQRRMLWLMEYDGGEYKYDMHMNKEHRLANMIQTIQNIPADKTIVIWCADNAHDQTGLRFALHLLRSREAPVHLVNLTKLFHASGEYGKALYAAGLIDREHFRKLVNDNYEGNPLDSSQRKRYEEEWSTLARQNHLLRLWENDTVISCDEHAMDEWIMQSVINLKNEQDDRGYIRAGSVVGNVLERSQQLVSYSFLLYRIWSLVNQSKLSFRGLPWAMHQFSIKLGEISAMD